MPIARTLLQRPIPMRDGANLVADVALPPGEGPFPVVLFLTPYLRRAAFNPPWTRVVDRGFALVGVDVRGRGDSDGAFEPWTDLGADGYDVVEWCASQPWSTGRVGMIGGSYDGFTQWSTARARPPHLTCMAPIAIGPADSGDRPFPWSSGVCAQYFLPWVHFVSGHGLQNIAAASWEANARHLPVATLDAAIGRPGSAWERYATGGDDLQGTPVRWTEAHVAALDIPVFVMCGWWDDERATLDMWAAIQGAPAADQARLVVGAWDHVGNLMPRPTLGGLDVAATMLDPSELWLRFLDRHLADADVEAAADPRVRVFRTGANRWEERGDWPVPEARPVPYHLHGGGLLAVEPPSSGEVPDTSWRHDPLDPVRPHGSLDASIGWPDPPLDGRYLERRPDVLTFSTPVLEAEVPISGPVVLDAWVSSDRPDTDLVAWLADVQPDGRSMLLGMMQGVRLRYRDPAGGEQLLEPGVPVRAELVLGHFHHTFLPGHRVRVVVASSYWPHFARNLGGTGHPAWQTEAWPAHNRLHHDELHPSRLLLPVEP